MKYINEFKTFEAVTKSEELKIVKLLQHNSSFNNLCYFLNQKIPTNKRTAVEFDKINNEVNIFCMHQSSSLDDLSVYLSDKVIGDLKKHLDNQGYSVYKKKILQGHKMTSNGRY